MSTSIVDFEAAIRIRDGHLRRTGREMADESLSIFIQLCIAAGIDLAMHTREEMVAAINGLFTGQIRAEVFVNGSSVYQILGMPNAELMCLAIGDVATLKRLTRCAVKLWSAQQLNRWVFIGGGSGRLDLPEELSIRTE